MKLTPPKKITYWISVILGVLGLIATFVNIPVVTGLSFWFVFVAFALLAIALLVKGI